MKTKIEEVKHSLELDEALQLHRLGWVVQRIGWALFLATLVLAALGLFGSGVLSKRTIKADGHVLKYERYGRYEATMHLHVQARPVNGQVLLQIPQEYLQQYKVEQITPEPEHQEVANGSYQYSFRGDGTINIVLYGMPKESGTIETRLLVNNTRFSISQFIYP